MSDPLPIERFADLSAEIEVTGDKEQVLSRETLPPEAWEKTKAHWLRVMADEAERRRLKLSIRYQNVFATKRKLYEARKRRAPLEDKLASVTPPVAHLDAATPVLVAPLVSSAERVNAPTPPRVEVPAVPRPAVVSAVRIEHATPIGFDAPSVPVVRTAPMAATPMQRGPVMAAPPVPAPQAAPAPPPRRMWSTMVTDGMPGPQPATPFRTTSESAIPAQTAARPPAQPSSVPAPPPPPPPPAPSSPAPPPVAKPPDASPPRDPKLAGTVTFDLDEMLGAQVAQAARASIGAGSVERVGSGTGPLPPARGNNALPFGRNEPPPAPPPPPSSASSSPPPHPAPPAPVPRGREPIPDHLQATTAVDLSQIIQAITPFPGKPASSAPAPHRVPTPPGSSAGLPFGAPQPRPSEPRTNDAARPRPPASLGATSFADPITSNSPATPFTEKPSRPTEKLQLGPPRLSINVFASIAAEIAESPAELEAILRKYAMDKEDHFEESMRWEAEFERNADMRLRYGGIVARYRGYIAQRRGK